MDGNNLVFCEKEKKRTIYSRDTVQANKESLPYFSAFARFGVNFLFHFSPKLLKFKPLPESVIFQKKQKSF